MTPVPEPVTGDLFFDIEGARYYSEDGAEFGLQYLFGIVDTADTGPAGQPRYVQFWAFDRQGEKLAFEAIIDFITERWRRHPGLHVYHYNHYEPTSVDHLTELHETRQEAVGRLMGRYATREDEVDNLFRLGVFVDLYRVVRQGLRAGVESHSIKRLEPLCGYGRQLDLREATRILIGLEAGLETGQPVMSTRRSGWWLLTTRMTAGPRSRCATGWSSGAPIWPDSWPRSCPVPSPRQRQSRGKTLRSPESGQRCWPAFPLTWRSGLASNGGSRCWLTCWTGTAGKPSLPGGGTSTCAPSARRS